MIKTNSSAARKAQPGDIVLVQAGIYRERVDPPRGGASAEKHIVYQAAPGEKVVITGAEVQKGWVRDKGDVWIVKIPNSFFGQFNPYANLIHGDWFNAEDREHHTGAVYLNGAWHVEAAELHDVYKEQEAVPQWFGHVTETVTTIWAQFKISIQIWLMSRLTYARVSSIRQKRAVTI